MDERVAERAAKIEAAIPPDAFDRLTRGRADLEADMKAVLVTIWNVGYDEGLHAGVRLFRDKIPATPPSSRKGS